MNSSIVSAILFPCVLYKNTPQTNDILNKKKMGDDILVGLDDAQLVEGTDTLLLPLLLCDPEAVLVLHNIRQHRASQEHHVLTTRRILNADLEVLFCSKEQKKERKKKGRMISKSCLPGSIEQQLNHPNAFFLQSNNKKGEKKKRTRKRWTSPLRTSVR